MSLAVADTWVERLGRGAEQLGLRLGASQLATLTQYLEGLMKWNRAYNLTAIRDPGEMVVKHLLDSLAIVPLLTGERLLDVGTGAGLPGIPAAICDPRRHWTLIDSNGKKTRFLLQMKSELALTNLEVLKGRVESLSPRQPFEAITSRAFSTLRDFVSVCLPLLSGSGSLLAMKGQVPETEVAELRDQGLAVRVQALDVPYLHEERHLIVVQRRTNG
ncbi:MAG: 16S rRNA (guanine(527)-N(7))-methyltransferase RsmG [Pseudomonadales bacterium]|nr:16S rRNA (guanine(527)-N(7))-methyltransferase RsmG [Pseudomonadales bacterium]